MPTPSFVAAGPLAANNAIATLAVVAPTLAADDIMIAALLNKHIAQTISPPDGTWTQLVQDSNDCTASADDHRFAVYWKRAASGDSGASFTFTKSSDDNLLFVGVISAWRDCAVSGSPLDATAVGAQKTAGAADAVTFPAFDPTTENTHVVFLAFYGNDQTTFSAAMSPNTDPACTLRFALESSTGTDASIAATSGDATGAAIASRTWPSGSFTDSGNTGIVFALIPVPTGITQAVGQATETDLAQPFLAVKQRPSDQASETDAAQALTRVKVSALLPTVETALAQPLTRRKQVLVVQALELETAQAMTAPGQLIIPVGPVIEGDVAHALTRLKRRTADQVTEADLAQMIARVKARALLQIVETDLAQGLTRRKGVTVTQVLELDTAQAISAPGLLVVPVGQASEGDVALAVAWRHTRLVARVTEADLAQAIVRVKQRPLGASSETDSAHPLTRIKPRTILTGAEVNLAQTLTHLKRLVLGRVTELDAAQTISRVRVVPVLTAAELDVAQALRRLKHGLLRQADETDLAQSILAVGGLNVSIPFLIAGEILVVRAASGPLAVVVAGPGEIVVERAAGIGMTSSAAGHGALTVERAEGGGVIVARG